MTHHAPEPTDGSTKSLICTVSTVKDSLANVQTFVARNLAAGVDHMFVFLDDADPDIHAHFARHPHVTTVRCGSRYWDGRRPRSLNRRQIVNANLVNVLLSPFSGVDWLFHVDGDECLDLDMERLPRPDERAAVLQLPSRETVAACESADGEHKFKRPLELHELILLAALGVIRRPRMKEYFNGHVSGKPGMRPSLDRRLGVHQVRELNGLVAPPLVDHGSHLLHYDSHSGDEFIRKWMAHVGTGQASRMSLRRDRLRTAVISVVENEALDENRKRDYLLEIHGRLVADDVATLDDLGYLVTPSPERHRHRPTAFTRAESGQVRDLLGRLLAADKRYFQITGDDTLDPRELLEEFSRDLGLAHRPLRRRLNAVLQMSHPQTA